MKWTIGIIVLLMSLSATAAVTGNELLNKCEKVDAPDGAQVTSDQQWNTMQCVGYINGVTDANNVWWAAAGSEIRGAPNYCIADGVKKDQVFRIVVKYLREHPERIHLPAARLINDALAGAFPCK